jgi:adenosylcobinamide kinase/adenosylcobinamide-phosphate guanylyltransferase
VITLLLGGARSGKSTLAEQIASTLREPVTYVATALVDDAGMAVRVAEHRARRPPGWETVEAGAGLVAAVKTLVGTVLIDSLGTWVSATPDFAADSAALCQVLRRRGGDTVVVSEEVGLGVHPSTEVGGRFRDALGQINQDVAGVADEVLLVVAGRCLRLEPPPDREGG